MPIQMLINGGKERSSNPNAWRHAELNLYHFFFFFTLVKLLSYICHNHQKVIMLACLLLEQLLQLQTDAKKK